MEQYPKKAMQAGREENAQDKADRLKEPPIPDPGKEMELWQSEQQAPKAVGTEQLKKFMETLLKYKTGLAPTHRRIIASENWWKLHNTQEEQKVTQVGKDGGFTSQSGWLHNVITSKHADAMASYPEPNILPREAGDKQEARMLSAIVPCVLEQNDFEHTYSDVQWQKFKFGTGVYKSVWDAGKLNGLGDIGVTKCNLLNLYWEPGVDDIQKGRFFFHTEVADCEELEQQYPDKLSGRRWGRSIISAKFLYDDQVSMEGKTTVVDVYYHKWQGKKRILHYCKFVEDVVLMATENDAEPVMDDLGNVVADSMAMNGLYDHGEYPYVFDALFPIEGSPCGYGFVDLCRNPQTLIDVMKTCFVKNAIVGATPRYFSRADGGVNKDQFLDLSNPLVDVTGSMDENALRLIGHNHLDGSYMGMLEQTIRELRETSGNTEASTGVAPSGVTAASALAALQEASGKGSRDSTMTSYRAYRKVVYLIIELDRQFYDAPRSFRITGQYGEEQFVTYSNAGLKPQMQGTEFGQDMGYRLPVFDIKVTAQKKNIYTKISQNELATQFFQMGFFNPQMTDQALMCLEMMDFDGKDQIMGMVQKNGTIFQKVQQYMQLAFALAVQMGDRNTAMQIQQDMTQILGGMPPASMGRARPMQQMEGDPVDGLPEKEHAMVRNARERADNASQPDGGAVLRKRG